jgi:hypothetical protein
MTNLVTLMGNLFLILVFAFEQSLRFFYLLDLLISPIGKIFYKLRLDVSRISLAAQLFVLALKLLEHVTLRSGQPIALATNDLVAFDPVKKDLGHTANLRRNRFKACP